MYKAAVIGIGRIGMLLESDPQRIKPATHFGMWTSHPRTELVAVCDNDPAKLAQAKGMLPSLETYTDAAALLREIRPDLVSISTWKDTHYEMMKLCLENGVKVIVCEKPIADRYDQAKEIVDQARARDVALIINHRRRFDDILYPLRDDISQGLIGQLLQVTTYYVFGLVTTGTHLVDTLRFLLGPTEGEVEWVSAHPNVLPHHAPPDDPCVDGFIGFESGLKASMQSLDIKKYDIFHFDFYGETGKIVLKNIGRDIDIYRVVSSPEHAGFTELEVEPSEQRGGTPRDQFHALADNAVDCLEGKATSLSTGEDSLKALEILVAMQRSVAEGGTRVKVG